MGQKIYPSPKWISCLVPPSISNFIFYDLSVGSTVPFFFFLFLVLFCFQAKHITTSPRNAGSNMEIQTEEDGAVTQRRVFADIYGEVSSLGCSGARWWWWTPLTCTPCLAPAKPSFVGDTGYNYTPTFSERLWFQVEGRRKTGKGNTEEPFKVKNCLIF